MQHFPSPEKADNRDSVTGCINIIKTILWEGAIDKRTIKIQNPKCRLHWGLIATPPQTKKTSNADI